VGSPFLYLVLAQWLSPEDFGLVGVAVSVMALLAILQQGGLMETLIQKEEKIEEAANVIFWLNIVLGCLLYILLFITAPFLATYYSDLRLIPIFRILGLQLIFAGLGNTQYAQLQRSFKFKDISFIQIAVSFLPFLVSIPLAIIGFRYWALVCGLFTSYLMKVLFVWLKTPWRPRISFNIIVAKQVIRFGGFVLLEAILGWFLAWCDNLIVGKYIGITALGIYSLAFNFSSAAVGVPLSAITGITLPAFSRIQKNRDILAKAYFHGNKIIAAYSIPAGIGLAITSSLVVSSLFGNKWVDMGVILAILSIYCGFGYLWILDTDIFKAIGKPETMAKIYIPQFLLMLPAYLYFSRYGLIPFSIARSVVALLFGILHSIFVIKLIKLPLDYFWKVIKVPIVATIFMSLLIIPITWVVSHFFAGRLLQGGGLLLILMIGLASYLGFLFLLDRDLVLEIFNVGKKVFGLNRTETNNP
jgi:O-antigen/teichoic acid export membrane protein